MREVPILGSYLTRLVRLTLTADVDRDSRNEGEHGYFGGGSGMIPKMDSLGTNGSSLHV